MGAGRGIGGSSRIGGGKIGGPNIPRKPNSTLSGQKNTPDKRRELTAKNNDIQQKLDEKKNAGTKQTTGLQRTTTMGVQRSTNVNNKNDRLGVPPKKPVNTRSTAGSNLKTGRESNVTNAKTASTRNSNIRASNLTKDTKQETIDEHNNSKSEFNSSVRKQEGDV